MHCYLFNMLWIQQGNYKPIILCYLQESVPAQCHCDILKHPALTQNGLFLAAQCSDSSHSPISGLFQIRAMSSWSRKITLIPNNIITVVVEEKEVSGLYFLLEISHLLNIYCFHGSLYATPCGGETSQAPFRSAVCRGNSALSGLLGNLVLSMAVFPHLRIQCLLSFFPLSSAVLLLSHRPWARPFQFQATRNQNCNTDKQIKNVPK